MFCHCFPPLHSSNNVERTPGRLDPRIIPRQLHKQCDRSLIVNSTAVIAQGVVWQRQSQTLIVCDCFFNRTTDYGLLLLSSARSCKRHSLALLLMVLRKRRAEQDVSNSIILSKQRSVCSSGTLPVLDLKRENAEHVPYRRRQ